VIRFLSPGNGWIATKLAHDGPRSACIQVVLKIKVEVKGRVIWALLWLRKKTKSLLSQANGLIMIKLISRLPSLHFLFFCTPMPERLWVCAVSSAIAHIVKQFVKLFVINSITGWQSRVDLGSWPPIFRSGGLTSKIAPTTFCVPKYFAGPFLEPKEKLQYKEVSWGLIKEMKNETVGYICKLCS